MGPYRKKGGFYTYIIWPEAFVANCFKKLLTQLCRILICDNESIFFLTMATAVKPT